MKPSCASRFLTNFYDNAGGGKGGGEERGGGEKEKKGGLMSCPVSIIQDVFRLPLLSKSIHHGIVEKGGRKGGGRFRAGP